MPARSIAIVALLLLPGGMAPAAEEGNDRPRIVRLPEMVPAPRDNRTTAAKAALGRRLFFDPRLSGDNSMSCASCHLPEKAFADGRRRSPGAGGKLLARNTPSVINAGLLPNLTWDGRAASLEQQALVPIASPVEMNQNLAELERELQAVDSYVEPFQRVFGGPPTQGRVAEALAAFQRTLVAREAPIDRHLAGDKTALSPLAKRGLELFVGEADCVRCHHGPLLTDGKFYRLGIVTSSDKGRGAVTGLREDDFKFRTPPLRDVAETAPYMHDGSIKTLSGVVEFYLRTAPPNGPGGLPLDIEPKLDLSYSDIDALVAFLKSLSGKAPEVAPPAAP